MANKGPLLRKSEVGEPGWYWFVRLHSYTDVAFSGILLLLGGDLDEKKEPGKYLGKPVFNKEEE